jgi:signal transduction histidine kinase
MLTHEINNPCSFALANLSLAKAQLAKTHDDPLPTLQQQKVQLMLEDCEQGLQRIQRIVGQFALFARGNQASLSSVAPLPCLAQAWQLATAHLSALPHPTFTLQHDDAHPDLQLWGNETLLCQAFTNLLSNAVDAVTCPPIPQAHISVSLLRQGNHCQLTFSDNGCGMDAALMEHVFDAFYSTKPLGKGSGLGLAMVRHSVNLHQGSVTLASHPQQGTQVVLQLPIAPTC